MVRKADALLPVQVMEGEILSGDALAASPPQPEPEERAPVEDPAPPEPPRRPEAPVSEAPPASGEAVGRPRENRPPLDRPQGARPGQHQNQRGQQPQQHRPHQQQGQGGKGQQPFPRQHQPQNQGQRQQNFGQARPQPFEARSRGDATGSVPLDELAAKAWEIYYTEIGQDGVSMFNDQDAQKLAQRSFRLAEIFLRELQMKGPRPGGMPQRREDRPAEDETRPAEERSSGGAEVSGSAASGDEGSAAAESQGEHAGGGPEGI